jgi:hypothetical protein
LSPPTTNATFETSSKYCAAVSDDKAISGADRWARACFGATAAVVLVGLVIQAGVVATNDAAVFPTVPGRIFNMFCVFTVQSNTLVGVTTLMLALQPDRRSTSFRAARLAGLVGIVVTFIVYHAAISHLLELDGWALAADNLLHTVVPVLAVVGWLLYGPRGMTSARIAVLAAVFPICWMAFTLVRGPIVNWYPYHFIDVDKLGYGKVAINSVWIAVLFLGLSAAATALDARLRRAAAA